MENQIWDKDRHELRTRTDQKFVARHPKRVVSLRKRRSNGSIGTSTALTRRRETVSGVSTKDPFGTSDVDEIVEESDDRAHAINAMRSWADDKGNWKGKGAVSHQSPPISPLTRQGGASREGAKTPSRFPAKERRLARERRRRANTVNSEIPVARTPLRQSLVGHGSSTAIKDGPDHNPELQPAESAHVRSNHNDDFQESSLPGDKDNRQDLAEQMKTHAEDYPPKYYQKWKGNDLDTQLQPSNSGHALYNDDSILRRDFGVSAPSNKRRNGHVPLATPPKFDQNIEEANNRESGAVSDKGKRPDEMGTSSETPPDPKPYERRSIIHQSQPSVSEPAFIDANSIRDLIEERCAPETNKAEKTPDVSYSHGTMEDVSHDPQPDSLRSEYKKSSHSPSNTPGSDQNKSPNTTEYPENDNSDVQPKSLGNHDMKSPDLQHKSSDSDPITMLGKTMHPSNDDMKIADPQPSSLGGDHIKGPDSEPQSSESERMPDKTNRVQDQIREDDDPEAWLNSDAPLVGNYRAFFHESRKPRSIGQASPRDHGSGEDSLIAPPAISDEPESFEVEDLDRITNVNEEIISLFDEYKVKSQLEPTPEEQEARYWRKAKKVADKNNRSSSDIDSKASSISTPSSDDSFLLSPGQESQTNAKAGLDDFEHAEEEGEEEEDEEEESNQAALDVIELHRANYKLQKDMEAKEANFKREIKQAWTRPRPPPTTEEQRRDQAAFDKINSKEIFDELGEQQRPITTDTYLIMHETKIDVMLTSARTCFLLEDYSGMYARANQAAEAASLLNYPPLTARCCYYRGLASYHHGEVSGARDDLVEARGCAGVCGITSESIERYIRLIDSGVDPETAAFEPSPAGAVSRGRQAERTRRAWRTRNPGKDESSPSSVEDATTLVGGSAVPLEHSSNPPSEGEPSAGQQQPHENVSPQTHVSRRPSHTDAPAPPLVDDPPQPPATTNDVPPIYLPQEEAISEEIRKDILESKAQSLNPTNEAHGSNPKASHNQEDRKKQKLAPFQPPPPSSLANTEWTLHGPAGTTTTSPDTTTTRHVPHPHVAPITTSIAATTAAASTSVREIVPGHSSGDINDDDGDDDGDDGEGDSDEMDSDEIYAAFGGRPGEGGDMPDPAQ